MTSTVLPAWASAAATLTVVVVLPTPPFWLATVITRVRAGRGTVRPLRVIRLRASAATAAASGVCPSAPGIAAAIWARTSVSSWVGASMRSSRAPVEAAGSVFGASLRSATGAAGVASGGAVGRGADAGADARCRRGCRCGAAVSVAGEDAAGDVSRETRSGPGQPSGVVGGPESRGKPRPGAAVRFSATSIADFTPSPSVGSLGATPIQPHGGSTRQSATAPGGQPARRAATCGSSNCPVVPREAGRTSQLESGSWTRVEAVRRAAGGVSRETSPDQGRAPEADRAGGSAVIARAQPGVRGFWRAVLQVSRAIVSAHSRVDVTDTAQSARRTPPPAPSAASRSRPDSSRIRGSPVPSLGLLVQLRLSSVPHGPSRARPSASPGPRHSTASGPATAWSDRITPQLVPSALPDRQQGSPSRYWPVGPAPHPPTPWNSAEHPRPAIHPAERAAPTPPTHRVQRPRGRPRQSRVCGPGSTRLPHPDGESP